MKKYILTFSFSIITILVAFTLMNCGSETPSTPCVPPKPPTVKSSIKINAGETISLTASSTEANASFSWTGPNSFTSKEQNPTLTNATENMAGNYMCKVTVNGCTSLSDTTIVLIQGVMTDPKDGHVYKTIKIGNQTWMAENFQWQPSSDYADYKICGGTPALGLIYGVLYNHKLAIKCDDGVTGWRLPTKADWDALVAYLGGYEVAGAKMKEAGTTHWVTPNSGTSNSSGFTAYGSGYFDVVNSLGYQDLKNRTYYWSQTPYTSYYYIMILRVDDMWSHLEYGEASNYYSVRLIKI